MNHLSSRLNGLSSDLEEDLPSPNDYSFAACPKSPSRIQRKSAFALLFVALAFNLIGFNAEGVQPPASPPLGNFDKRHGALVKRQPPSEEQASAIAELKRRAPGLKVELDPITRSPKTISNPVGFLTGPNGVGVTTSKTEAAAFPDGEPHRSTKAFLKEHKKLFGHGPEALEQARIQREFAGAHNGLKTVVWEQQLDGLPIFEAVLISHTTAKGELVSLSSQFVANPQSAGEKGTKGKRGLMNAPAISARQAITLAAKNLGEEQASEANLEKSAEAGAAPGGKQKFKAAFLRGESEAKLLWLPMDGETLRPCWDVLIGVRKHPEMFRILIDIETGEPLLRRCMTTYISDATFRVFTSDSPSPFSPGHPVPITNQPALVPRTLLTLPALDTNASPSGWINDGINETLGNNVDAHTDWNDDDYADLPRPSGSPFRIFDFPMDLTTQDPSVYTNASVAQLFYRCNWMHDKLYQLGFNEAAGNFQTTNFGRGGYENDALQADAQDGGGYNNANMYTPPDGSPPRMQMYIFSGSYPRRDAALDSEIVLHEYTHGLSNRRVGGGIGLSAFQSEGMGEGWSDFYALTLLSESGDDVNGVYAKGAYSTYQLASGFTQNYYYGIRRYPYSTDLSKNPLTFRDIDPNQASAHSGVPHSSVIYGSADEVHSQGEVWCVTLWEARANLINKYGYAVGNQLILQLVTDGMNLSVPNPTFLEARDAIIQADLVNNGGANRRELWTAFAKRGMGVNATSPSSYYTTGVHESFDVPDDLLIMPVDGFTASGPLGGPFNPSSQTFTLNNSGSVAINWSLGNTSSWLTVSSSSGTLPPGTGASVSISLNSSVFSLPKGIYSATVRFTNLISGYSFSRQVSIRVGQPEYFTELFSNLDNDLDFKTFTFTPNGSTAFYSACREVATNYPTPTNNAKQILISNHSTLLTTVSNATISLYGVRTNQFYLSSDGNITLRSPDSSGDATLQNHFSLPRVSALYAHLHPQDGGVVLWNQLSNRVAITFDRIYDYNSDLLNSFQIELFFDGKIRLTYLNIGTQSGLVGLSAGTGLPADFVESDFSTYPACTPPFRITVPAGATEGDGVLAGAGQIVLPSPLATNLIIALNSSDTSEVIVPASVTLLAGQTNAPFDIIIVNDSILDGTQVATITGSNPGFVGSPVTIQVHDNESAVLQLTIPSTLTEGGSSTQGVLRVSAAPAVDVTVSLLLSPSPAIQVPPLAVLPAGQTSIVFPISIIDDNLIDGPQNTVVTAHVQNWTDGIVSVTVLDNETLDLTVSLPSFATEGNGVLANGGQVRLSGVLQTNLEITLSSSDTSELILPPTIVIPAGQSSVFFPLIVVDDGAVDGNQPVTVTATAGGFSPGSASMQIVDDESPPLPANPYPPNLASNIAANVTLTWAGCGGGISNEVYLGTLPNLGPADYVGTTTACNWSAGLLAPNTTYYWQIVSRTLGTTVGPVWRFTTRGVDHFDLSTVASTQYMEQPFNLAVTARDELNRVVTNFTGPVSLAANGGLQSKILFADNFEDGNFSDWAIGSDIFIRAVTNDTAAGGVFSFTQIGPPSISHYGGVSHALTNIRPSRITFYVRSGNSALASGYFVTGQSSGTLAFFYMRDDATMGLVGNSPQWYSVPYVARQWYKITLDLDWSTSQIDYYVNDTLAYSKVPFLNFVPALTTVYLYNFHNTQAWWDEIQMTADGAPAPLLLSATNSGVFTNGVWSGNIAILQPSSNAFLTVIDAQGHSGSGNLFTVLPYNDLSLSSIATPDPVDVGAALTYTVRVTNSGPSTATNVRLTNTLPAQLNLLNYSASQGSCSLVSDTIICNLGSLTGGSSATLSFTGSSLFSGPLTNRCFVTRAEAEGYTSNNFNLLTTTVRPPTVFASDTVVEEGDFGFTKAFIQLRLSSPANQPVSIAFSTLDEGSASGGIDFGLTNGSVTFAPGTTNQTISLNVFGDTFLEPDEYFFVNLYSPLNAILGTNLVRVTILNDDNIPGKLHHFAWSPIPSPQIVSAPFRAAITAVDAFNNTVTNFTGSVTLASTEGQTNNILGSPTNSVFSSGTYTLGYSFTPSADLTVTHVRHIFGTRVSIWTESGTLLVAQPVSSVPGTWLDTPLAAPLQLVAGTKYRIGAYTGGNTYYYTDNLGFTFPNGNINGGYYYSGDGFPNITNSTRWFLVDLRYTYGTPITVPISPTTTSAFTNGTWAGNIAALAQVTNLVLRAADTANHAGISNPFHVSASNQPPIILTQPLGLVAGLGSSASFRVTTFGTPPLFYQWRQNGSNVPNATNATLTLSGLTTNQGGTYQVIVTNFWGAADSAGALLTVSEMPVVAVFDDPTYVDTSGSASAESDNVQASLTNLNFLVTTFTDLGSAATANNILLIPDLEMRSLAPDLTPTTRAALSNFVQAGGLLIVHGDAGTRSGALLNALFGFTISQTGLGSSTTPYLLTTAANGTSFSGGPATLTMNGSSATLYTFTLPPGSLSIYEYAGQSLVALIPFGNGNIVYLGWDWYNAAPRGTQNGGWLPVLASAVYSRIPATQEPIIRQQPASRNVFSGASVNFSVFASGASPLRFQWRKDAVSIPGATNSSFTLSNVSSSDAGLYSVLITNSYGSALSSNAALTVVNLPPDAEFQILSLGTSNSRVIDHDALTGDDRGGIAASSTQLLYSGDFSSARFALSDLSGGASLNRVFDALTSDLRTGTIYSLANGTTPLTGSGLPITSLLEHDGTTGLLTGSSIQLSSPIPLSGTAGIFAGYGRVVIHAGTRAYNISLPTGVVTDLGAMSAPFHQSSESWAYWGVAEYFGGTVYMVYVRDSQTISRTAVPTGTTTTVSSFSSLSDMASFTVSIPFGRWYFHHEGSSQFGGSYETIGYADAQFMVTSGTNPPVIFTQPVGRSVKPGTNVVLSVVAQGGGSIGFQWRKDGTNLANGGRIAGANSPSLLLSNVVDTDSGLYSVLVTNLYGSVLSSNAPVLVSALDHFSWSAIASPEFAAVPFTVSIQARDASNKLLTNFAGSVPLKGVLGGLSTNNILGSVVHSNFASAGASYTLGYSFTPATNITVTHVRSYFGTKVSIWSDTGTLLASQNVTSTPGAWTETPLPSPLILTGGQAYRVGVYILSGYNYYWRPDLGTNFPAGSIGQGYDGNSDTFPTSPDSTRWLVDLRFTKGVPIQAPITPSVSGSFVQGVWTGNVQVSQAATNLTLVADNGIGQSGESNPFNVLSQPRLDIQRYEDVMLIEWPANSAKLILEYSQTLNPPAWLKVATPPLQIDDQFVVPVQLDKASGFYRLRRTDP